MERELENNTNSVIPFFSLNLGVMIAFCIITCMMTDWVKSKPVLGKGPFNNYVDKMRGGRGSKNVCFYPHSGYKNCPRRGRVKKWQNSVHVVVECPLRHINNKDLQFCN